ncbi:hypothetical protein [Pleurocapsa sp. PCC 7319]|uniref:hypothetical protein n=1 Tax=Pleurocapsa sp. PCC 7319 TaxID=118161 RepID=UPI00034D6E73|nr:hypothetical protein [Pleurocapsa sp. PCC 7319]
MTTSKPPIQFPDIPPLGSNMGNIIGNIPPESSESVDSDTFSVQEKITPPKSPVQSPDIKPIKTSKGDIFPARGIIKTEDGQVILTAYPTDKIDTRTSHISPKCSQGRG